VVINKFLSFGLVYLFSVSNLYVQWTSNVTAVSDYLFNAMSQTDNNARYKLVLLGVDKW